jgi:hypothetical protein
MALFRFVSWSLCSPLAVAMPAFTGAKAPRIKARTSKLINHNSLILQVVPEINKSIVLFNTSNISPTNIHFLSLIPESIMVRLRPFSSPSCLFMRQVGRQIQNWFGREFATNKGLEGKPRASVLGGVDDQHLLPLRLQLQRTATATASLPSAASLSSLYLPITNCLWQPTGTLHRPRIHPQTNST